MLRYRTGVDRRTGAVLTGWAHCAQSVDVILSTRLDERVMRLLFGSAIATLIGRPLAPHVLLDLYRKAIAAVHLWEPEFRVKRIDVLQVERAGGLCVSLKGLYYPEGRLGNYDITEVAQAVMPFAEMAA